MALKSNNIRNGYYLILYAIHSGVASKIYLDFYRIWSKLIMISAPQLPEDSTECVLYLFSFCFVFDKWETTREKYTL
jgi:hypothetical protein